MALGAADRLVDERDAAGKADAPGPGVEFQELPIRQAGHHYRLRLSCGRLHFAAGDPRASEGIGWITTIGVIEAYRGKGIGAALLEICEQKMDMPVVRLCVRRSNAVAQHMYRKAGYLPTGMWNHYYEDGEDALVLQKERRPADLHS